MEDVTSLVAMRNKAIEDLEKKHREKTTQDQFQANQAILAAQSSLFSSLATMTSEFSQFTGDQSRGLLAFQKAASIAQIAIDTASSISKSIAAATAAAAAGGPAAPFLVGGYIATMVASDIRLLPTFWSLVKTYSCCITLEKFWVVHGASPAV